MTLGLVLIFIGVQLNFVQSYELTPRFSNFLSENGGPIGGPTPLITTNNGQYNSPYMQASFPNATLNPNQSIAALAPVGLRTINVPTWLCWPVLFLGAVVFLHGFSKRS